MPDGSRSASCDNNSKFRRRGTAQKGRSAKMVPLILLFISLINEVFSDGVLEDDEIEETREEENLSHLWVHSSDPLFPIYHLAFTLYHPYSCDAPSTPAHSIPSLMVISTSSSAAASSSTK